MSYDITNPIYPKPAVNASGAIASQSLTVTTASGSFATAYSAEHVRTVCLDIQTSNMRVRFDGTAPTSVVGHILYVGNAYEWAVSRFNAAKFILDTSAAASGTIYASPDAS